MLFNELDQIVYGVTLCWVPLFSCLIPCNMIARHEVRNCLLVEFYGSGAAQLRHRIFIRLWCTEGLVGQIPINVNIPDLQETGLGEYIIIYLLVFRVVQEGHKGTQGLDVSSI
jgi:hypothetical protein